MNPEDNKAVIRRLFASVDAHNFDPLEGDLFAPEYHLQFDSMPRMDKASAVPFFQAFAGGLSGHLAHHRGHDCGGRSSRDAPACTGHEYRRIYGHAGQQSSDRDLRNQFLSPQGRSILSINA